MEDSLYEVLKSEILDTKNRVQILENEVNLVKTRTSLNELTATNTLATLTKIDNKIGVLEGIPKQRWETAIRTIITVVITCLITWFVTK